MDNEVGFTVKGNELLNRMAVGELDGFVGKPLMTPKGVCFWLVIQDGNPTCYSELPTEKKLEAGNIKRSLGTMLSVKSWLTDEEKLAFLRENGAQIDDPAVKNYAAREAQSKGGLFVGWKETDERGICIYPYDTLMPLQ